MSPRRSHDSEYEPALLTSMREQARVLGEHNKVLRARAADAVETAQRLRAQCAALRPSLANPASRPDLRKPQRHSSPN